MIAAIILAPFIALIVWVVGNHYGISLGYWQTIVYVLVAKVVAMYLKNDVVVDVELIQHVSKTKEDE